MRYPPQFLWMDHFDYTHSFFYKNQEFVIQGFYCSTITMFMFYNTKLLRTSTHACRCPIEIRMAMFQKVHDVMWRVAFLAVWRYFHVAGQNLEPTILAILSQANRDYSTSTRQLKASIIKVCVVQVLRLRTNPQWVHEAKYLTTTNGTYSHTGFHNGQVSCFNMKVAKYLY